MRAFGDYNPIVVTVYFLTVAGIAMFCMNPILLFSSLLGAVLFFVWRNREQEARSHVAFLLLFVGIALLNPLVSHNGRTVLFVLNDAPITLEAILYGVTMAGMIAAVLYWFRSFTQIMSADKLLYLFGKLSPKLALVFSMGLRYVPLFGRQITKIRQSQTALGLYKEESLFARIRGGLSIFSTMMTWALENGIVTADSMTARGYGIGQRSHFSIFRFCRSDGCLLLFSVLLGGLTCLSLGTGALDVTFYPTVQFASITPMSLLGYLSYGAMTLLPTLIEVEEKIRWKFLQSKI